ncbi:glycosyltransferase, partial [Chloroflexota bacterium]
LSVFDIACSPKIDCFENRAANPVKIYEYMAMGLPMVISAVGEPSNVIEDGSDGYLIKPDDENDLQNTLERVLQNMCDARQMGERARQKIVENYTQTVMERIIIDALNNVLIDRV